MNPMWPIRTEAPETYSERAIEQMADALENYGHYNAPTALEISRMLRQLLRERIQLHGELDQLKARLAHETP